MVSPLCEVKDGAGAYVSTANGVNVTPGNTVTIRLIDSSASTWSISCVYTDDQSAVATVNTGLTIDPVARTATFTAPVAGRAYIFKPVVNNGIGPDGRVRTDYSTTFGVYTLTGEGRRVIAANETNEGDSEFGWVKPVNEIIRNGGGGGSASTATEMTWDPAADPTTSQVARLEAADTTDATVTTLASAVQEDETTTDWTATVVARGADGTSYVCDLRKTYSCTAGVMSEVRDLGVLNEGGTLAASAEIDYSGTTVRVRYTGPADPDTTASATLAGLVVRREATAPPAPAGIDPATLSPTALWLDYAGAPWVDGVAAESLTSGTAPAVGASFGTHPSADFDGVADLLNNASALTVFLGTGAFTIDMVLEADALGATASIYDEVMLFGDVGGNVIVSLATSGVRVGIANTLAGWVQVTSYVAVPATGTKFSVQVKYDGVDLKIRVNGGAWASVASAAIETPAALTMQVGANYDLTKFFDGRLARLVTWSSAVSDVNLDGVYVHAQSTLAVP